MKILKYSIFISLFTIISCSSNDDNHLRLGVSTTLDQSGVITQLAKQFSQQSSLPVTIIALSDKNPVDLLLDNRIDVAISPIDTKTVDDDLHYSTLFTSNYFIAGPKNDPAHIQHSLTVDEVIKKIINAQSQWLAQSKDTDLYLIEQALFDKNNIAIEPTVSNDQKLIEMANQLPAYFLIDTPRWLAIENTQNSGLLFSEEDHLKQVYSVLSLKNTENKDLKPWITWLKSEAAKEIIANFMIKQQPLFTITP